MRPETLKKLQAADEDLLVGFDWKQVMSRVRDLKPKIEKLAGRAFKMDEHVQDATHLTEIFLLEPEKNPQFGRAPMLGIVFSVRFSLYGSLFTVMNNWSEEDEQLPPSVIEQIIKATEYQGFIYIVEYELWESYTGKYPNSFTYGERTERSRKLSWWDRFFDYIGPASDE